MRLSCLWFILSFLALRAHGAGEPVVLSSDTFRCKISTEARTVSFVDLTTGSELLAPGEPAPCAFVRIAGVEHPATAATFANGLLNLTFGQTGATVVLRATNRSECVLLTVHETRGPPLESVTFFNAPLRLRARPTESFGACALALDLQTRIEALPALQRELRASCETRFGIIGSSVAIVATPMPKLLSTLRNVLDRHSTLPVCRVAGPWAHETPFCHGSYLFNFGTLTETNVADWIAMTRSVGFNQIDNHGGGEFFRFGDLELNRTRWPDGWDGYRRIVDRLHQEGIGSILHTYAFFIDKRSRYVTPVPDRRLDAFRTFTLADRIEADATEIPVNESTAGISTVMGLFEYNSLTLHLDDELVTFTNVTRSPPWKFLGVQRGAHATKPTPHERSVPARQLKECLGLFVPDVESTLFTEIAANHADVANRCGFDGIYLDAIDCSAILRGHDQASYWGSKFVVEIQRRLTRPVGMEMSVQWHHFWQYRTRWQAWDYPQRGHKRFVDLHADTVNGGLLLPLHLGWWGFQSWDPPQIEPTYSDVMEHLGARMIGWNAGASLTAGVHPKTLRNNPLFGRAAAILATCEQLRHSTDFNDSVRAQLRDPANEFALTTNASGKVRFRRIESLAHVAASTEPVSLDWSITNRFSPQPVRLRIEALSSAVLPNTPSGSVQTNPFTRTPGPDAPTWTSTLPAHVTASLSPNPDGSWSLHATNSPGAPADRSATWPRFTRTFPQPLNLGERKALHLDVEGDGSGALLVVRLESPRALSFGAVADRYVRLDFTGRRTLTLVETESSRWADFAWNDGHSPYNAFRETVHFDAIESVTVGFQDLPTARPVHCRIHALEPVALDPTPVDHPRFSINGTEVGFPIRLAPGSWIEANGPTHVEAFDPRGKSLGQVTPVGTWPRLEAGTNTLRLKPTATTASNPARSRITVFAQGPEL
jgi:hypothetical protein